MPELTFKLSLPLAGGGGMIKEEISSGVSSTDGGAC